MSMGKLNARAMAWEYEDGEAIGVSGVDSLDEAAEVIHRDVVTERVLGWLNQDEEGRELEHAEDRVDLSTLAGVREALDQVGPPAVLAVPGWLHARERWDFDSCRTLSDVAERPGRGFVKVLWFSW
jgi:hypothetical protein